MGISTLMGIILGALKIIESIMSVLETKQIKDAGKSEAIAETLSSILSKVRKAHDIENRIDALSDDDINRRLRNNSKNQ